MINVNFVKYTFILIIIIISLSCAKDKPKEKAVTIKTQGNQLKKEIPPKPINNNTQETSTSNESKKDYKPVDTSKAKDISKFYFILL